ncbi:helix-turn-helix domain-containing protein [Roseateles sp. L2-2]|uniref:helix-turn-helix domain-containing protein n=1 Tax=Roseateles TaxID=93681 RepID=UPI003D360B84
MSRSLKSIVAALPPERRAKVEAKSREMADDMIRYAETLAQARRALEKTQTELADVLQIKQNAVAQLEKRSDMLLSTLRKYVSAMGAELQLTIRTAAGVVIVLDGFGTLLPETSAQAAKGQAKLSGRAVKSKG